MATMILSTIGNSLFGPIGGFIGAITGRQIDGAITSEINGYKTSPSKLGNLKVQTSQEGAVIPIVYGKACLSGQLIWASEFKETTVKRNIGGKTGQKVKDKYYSISFAIGLCEGEINGIGKVWANGEIFDISQTEFRFYKGTETQEKDPLLEAVLGVENTPNYKGTAYVIFEDFPLESFNDRIPQLSFEIFKAAKNENTPEQLIEGVCLIPGAGEFVYETEIIKEVIVKGKEPPINQNASNTKSDFLVAIDNLQRDLPNVKNISLVAAWFGDNIDAAICNIKPKVDNLAKVTKPNIWHAAGLSRDNAELISLYNGNPAYGGTPSDLSIIHAIIELKNRGFNVCLNPFLMMDTANYPWRGRIFANSQNAINQFYGNVNASHFNINGENINYSGPDEWTYSRFILHMAALSKAAGGAHCFIIGSELLGLTRALFNNGFPFVAKLIELASEVRIILGLGAKITYAADWTEYGALYLNHNLYFPLDDLWANNNIDFIGIDYYAPLSDRDDDMPYAIDDFANNIEHGEAFDYYYADENARLNRIKTPIIDGLDEHWVYRQKDIRGFWGNKHYNRINGVKTTQTLWLPKSKPIRFMEFGVAAIDKGANRPSVFPDAKSIESGLPPFSNGQRDDNEQRNVLAAFHKYWKTHNETSDIYNGDMIANTYVWAWDARPYPQFPAKSNIWADAENMEKGHWLMGRMGTSDIENIILDIGEKIGMNFIANNLNDIIDGYIIETEQSARDALEPIINLYNINPKPIKNTIDFSNKYQIPYDISAENIILNEHKLFEQNTNNEDKIGSLSFYCYAPDRDYEIIGYTAFDNNYGKSLNYNSAIICNKDARENFAKLLLINANEAQNNINILVDYEIGLKAEIGDIVNFDKFKFYRINNIDGISPIRLGLSKYQYNNVKTNISFGNIPDISYYTTPKLFILDLPKPFSDGKNPIAFAASAPFVGNIDILVNNQIIGTIDKPSSMGRILNGIPASNSSQKLSSNLEVILDFGEIINGYAAIIDNGKVLDIIYFDNYTLIAKDTYSLSGIICGFSGENKTIPINADILFLAEGTKLSLDNSLFGMDIDYTARSNINPNSDVEIINAKFDSIAQKPWSVCHVLAKRNVTGINISFIPRVNGGFDNLDFIENDTRKFQIEILKNNQSIFKTETNETFINYTNEMVDFGAIQENIIVRIYEINSFGYGLKYEDTVDII